MVVSSITEAWAEAKKLINTDYMHDTDKSAKAGYPIYYSTAYGVNEWISDLGDRLEVNHMVGKQLVSTNIWIDDRHPLEKSGFKLNFLGIWVDA